MVYMNQVAVSRDKAPLLEPPVVLPYVTVTCPLYYRFMSMILLSFNWRWYFVQLLAYRGINRPASNVVWGRLTRTSPPYVLITRCNGQNAEARICFCCSFLPR